MAVELTVLLLLFPTSSRYLDRRLESSARVSHPLGAQGFALKRARRAGACSPWPCSTALSEPEKRSIDLERRILDIETLSATSWSGPLHKFELRRRGRSGSLPSSQYCSSWARRALDGRACSSNRDYKAARNPVQGVRARFGAEERVEEEQVGRELAVLLVSNLKSRRQTLPACRCAG